MNPLESWTEEQRSAFLYRACADAENGTVRAELFRRLAGEAEAQAAIWRAQLTARGHPAPGPFVPDARTRLVASLVQWLGPRRLKNVLAAMKVRGMAIYGAALPSETGHTRAAGAARCSSAATAAWAAVATCAPRCSASTTASSRMRASSSGWRAPRPICKVVVLSGVAGMAAGAFAMAAGEYVSVQSQRELYEYQIALERDELKQYPEAEAQELALIYAAKGLPAKQADRLAKRLVADPENALDTLAREELGLNPGELGSPLGAAMSSLCAFGAGAFVPLAPYLLGGGSDALGVDHRPDRGGAVQRGRHAVALHRSPRGVLRCADARDWRFGGWRHILARPPARRDRRLTSRDQAALRARNPKNKAAASAAL